jgi:hypothetical protein
MRRGALLLVLALSPGAARAQALGELLQWSGSASEAVRPDAARAVKQSPARKTCPADWEKKKTGGCWTTTGIFDGEGEVRAYVHPAGWVVDPRCFADKRFDAREFLDALTTAARKMDPEIPVENGGCLGTYNPAFGREMKDQVWTNHMYVQCPQNYDRTEWTCADEGSRDAYLGGPSGYQKGYYRMISLRNISGCTVKGSTGLSGTLFHETLHAVGADNVPVEVHNSHDRPQIEFIRDRVYGTEATCYLGPKANLLQCRAAVAYDADRPRYDLCRGFSAVFTDMSAGTVK